MFDTILECRRRFELYTHHDLQPGQEFCITYGTTKSNPELLRDYGFTLPGNAADDAEVKDDLRGFLLQGAQQRACWLPSGGWVAAPHIVSCV